MTVNLLKSIVAITLLPLTGSAQYTFFRPDSSFAIEASLENTIELRMPMYRNAMTALVVAGDFIVGGTTAERGLAPMVFTSSVSKRKITSILDLDAVISKQVSISTNFTPATNGNLFYAGTMPQAGASGHIIQVTVDAQGKPVVKDLVAPAVGEGVFALTFSKSRNEFYGILHPSGKFFTYNLTSGKTVIYDQTAPTEADLGNFHSFALAPEDFLCRSLVIDAKGRVYGSKAVNRLFVFDPGTKSFTTIKEALPFVWGREVMGRIDSWVKMTDGTIYGSNAADGQLFRLDPVKQTIVNLGKPIMMPRIMTMTPGKNKMLYGIAGAAPGYAHLFSYHPDKGFRDLGNPEFPMIAPGLEQGINWRVFQISSITTSSDGRYIVMGENEALSQLMVFPAENQP